MTEEQLDRITGALFVAEGADVMSTGECDALKEQLRADAQALADVRTLDDWQSLRGRQVEQWTHDPLTYVELRERNGDELTAHVVVFADTPDEARAKAAAWVREQKP